MKRPTRAAWKRHLLAYEGALNALLADGVTDEDKEALFRVHDLLRLRAGGASNVGAVEGE